MTTKITIKPSDHSYACEDGETVLAAAMRNDLMLPYGCRNGACGTCKGRILSGEVDCLRRLSDMRVDRFIGERLDEVAFPVPLQALRKEPVEQALDRRLFVTRRAVDLTR